MNNKGILVDLFRVLPRHSVKQVVWYGNLGGRDIDLLVVSWAPCPLRNICWQNLDIALINQKDFTQRVAIGDPLVTEPLLTGRQIYGLPLAPYRQKVCDLVIGKETTMYLREQAELFYCWAKEHWYHSDYGKAANTLRFVFSYMAWCQYYRFHSEVASLAEVVSSFGIPCMQAATKLTKYNSEIDLGGLAELLRIAQGSLYCQRGLSSQNLTDI